MKKIIELNIKFLKSENKAQVTYLDGNLIESVDLKDDDSFDLTLETEIPDNSTSFSVNMNEKVHTEEVDPIKVEVVEEPPRDDGPFSYAAIGRSVKGAGIAILVVFGIIVAYVIHCNLMYG